jgi:alpha-ketoglutarate-dependent taurine dioxygenase
MNDPVAGCRVAADDALGLVDVLARRGLVLVDGLADSVDLLRLARSVATVVPHRDSASDGVTTLVDLGSAARSGFAGFSACALDPHTDRSGVAHPPALLMLSCSRPATSGGECVLIDGQAVYLDLAEAEPEALAALCAPRSVLFGGASGHLGATIDRHAVELNLSAGQGYVLDNHRWLHGRRAFTGHRVVRASTGTRCLTSASGPASPPERRAVRHERRHGGSRVPAAGRADRDQGLGVEVRPSGSG